MRLEAREMAYRLRDRLAEGGARVVDPAILQPAEMLLDLYGEDIRARAYVSADPALGEVMLRPDFTVPVARMHRESGAGQARYTYAGEVFRRQEDHPGRASEYLQVGFEIFADAAPADADAEVFATLATLLEGRGLRAVTGDIGILTAAVGGLRISARRRAALMRHIWRPRRFRALLERFAGRHPVPPSRAALLNNPDPLGDAPPVVGLRSRAEIARRIDALKEDAAEPPLSQDEMMLVDAVLAVRETSRYALARLRDIAVDLPALTPALERAEARFNALAARGVDAEALEFEASFGRSSMEYYDGFVFGFLAPGRPDMPAVATGGRYDALTERLGPGAPTPAVGGVIRPDLLLSLGPHP